MWTVENWLEFAGLMGGMVAGGVSALTWLLIRIGHLDTRLTRIETILELAFPEAKERAAILDSSRRVGAKIMAGRRV